MTAVVALLAVWLITGVGLANGIHGDLPFWYWLGWIMPIMLVAIITMFCVIFIQNKEKE